MSKIRKTRKNSLKQTRQKFNSLNNYELAHGFGDQLQHSPLDPHCSLQHIARCQHCTDGERPKAVHAQMGYSHQGTPLAALRLWCPIIK